MPFISPLPGTLSLSLEERVRLWPKLTFDRALPGLGSWWARGRDIAAVVARQSGTVFTLETGANAGLTTG